MIEFKIDDRDYRCERMNVFDQAHLLATVSPIVAGIAPLFLQLAKTGGLQADVSALPELLKPLAQALSEMPKADRESLITMCVKDVKVSHEGRMIALWNTGARRAMLDDHNDLFKLLRVVIAVVQGNLGNFSQGLLTAAGQAPESPTK